MECSGGNSHGEAAPSSSAHSAVANTSAPSLKLPNFFIIGAPKSGTTALSEYLRTHPNIFFSPIKEPEFFSTDISKRLPLDRQSYLALFSAVNPAVHKAVGEGSTGYLFSRVAAPEILKFNPDARFIVMLRNPVDLVQALHSEMCFWGGEDVRDFEAAWRLEARRRMGMNLPRHSWDDPRKLMYSDWGKLGEQMERLYSRVPRERVKVILFDDFAADTARVYAEVLAFLGVPSDGKHCFPAINENRALRFPSLHRALAMSLNFVRWALAAAGFRWKLRLGLSQKLLALNTRPAKRRGISTAMRMELVDYFREDVRRLSELIERDLSIWIPDERPQRSSPEHPLLAQ